MYVCVVCWGMHVKYKYVTTCKQLKKSGNVKATGEMSETTEKEKEISTKILTISVGSYMYPTASKK